MSSNFSVLIFSTDGILNRLVAEELERMKCKVFLAHNISEFVFELGVRNIDFIVFDLNLMINNRDAMRELDIYRNAGRVPVTIAYTNGLFSFVDRAIYNIGVDYYFSGGLFSRILKYTIMGIEAQRNKINKEDIYGYYDIVYVLCNIGILPNLKGFAYLKTAIDYVLRRNEKFTYITKNIYPQIAKEYNTTSTAVERAIRHAIDKAFKNGIPKPLEKAGITKTEMSNLEFISTVSEVIRNMLRN